MRKKIYCRNCGEELENVRRNTLYCEGCKYEKNAESKKRYGHANHQKIVNDYIKNLLRAKTLKEASEIIQELQP